MTSEGQQFSLPPQRSLVLGAVHSYTPHVEVEMLCIAVKKLTGGLFEKSS